jgi:hypothetical protein
MNAYKIETVLSEDGALMLQGLPFHVGAAVEVIILERSPNVSFGESSSHPNLTGLEQQDQNLYPLQGKQPYRYDDPFEPATPIEDWEILK